MKEMCVRSKLWGEIIKKRRRASNAHAHGQCNATSGEANTKTHHPVVVGGRADVGSQ
jgi:hypothetical protein